MKTLIRRRIMRRLIWVCTVCRCPTKRTPGLFELRSSWKKNKCLILIQCSKGKTQFVPIGMYRHSGSVGRAPAGGCGFDPRLSHTKDFKNGISCSFARRSGLGIRTGQLSVSIMRLGTLSCKVSGRDISVKQHSKT